MPQTGGGPDKYSNPTPGAAAATSALGAMTFIAASGATAAKPLAGEAALHGGDIGDRSAGAPIEFGYNVTPHTSTLVQVADPHSGVLALPTETPSAGNFIAFGRDAHAGVLTGHGA